MYGKCPWSCSNYVLVLEAWNCRSKSFSAYWNNDNCSHWAVGYLNLEIRNDYAFSRHRDPHNNILTAQRSIMLSSRILLCPVSTILRLTWSFRWKFASSLNNMFSKLFLLSCIFEHLCPFSIAVVTRCIACMVLGKM